MNRTNRKYPWELEEEEIEKERNRNIFTRIWHKIRGCLVWIGATIAAIIDFLMQIF